MKRTITALAVTMAAATIASAHSGVKNPFVKTRMDNMGNIKVATATLGKMAQGKAGFDASAAAGARAALIAGAEMIPEHFQAPEDDPKSEARPAIWTNWDDFVAKAELMQTAATALDTSDLSTLRAGFGAIGAACGACHKAYRE